MSADDYDDLASSHLDESDDTDKGGSCAADVAVGVGIGATAGGAAGVPGGPVTVGVGAATGAITGGGGTLITSPNCKEYQVDPDRAANDYSEPNGMS